MIVFPTIQKEFHSGGRTFRLSIPELKIDPGKVTYLVGPNGSGKSLYLAEVHDCFSNGSASGISIDEMKITGSSVLIRQIPDQNLSLSLSVLENISIWDQPRSLKAFLNPTRHLQAKTLQWEADLPSLKGVWHQQADSLSGGQKQAVVLLSRLLAKPSLLLLDEVFSAVEERLIQPLNSVLSEYLNTNLGSCISISHDIADVSASADRVIVFSNGRLVADLRRGDRRSRSRSEDMRTRILKAWPI